MLPSELLEFIECAMPHRCARAEAERRCAQCELDYAFIANKPVMLLCEHQICQDCDEKAQRVRVKCKICASQHADIAIESSGIKNKLIDKTIRDNMPLLQQNLREKFTEGHQLLRQRKSELESGVEDKRQAIKSEIDLSIKLVQEELELVRLRLYKDVDKYCEFILE